MATNSVYNSREQSSGWKVIKPNWKFLAGSNSGNYRSDRLISCYCRNGYRRVECATVSA